MAHRLLALAVAGLALAEAPAASAAPSSFPDDHSFIVSVSHANLAEVAAGRLALRKSHTAPVRAYARRMITDHTKAQRSLAAVARAWSTTVPRGPSAQQKREAARLEALSGGAFDRAYMRRQVADHRQVLSLMLLEADTGRVADVRGFAATRGPVVREHLAMAKAVRRDLVSRH